VNFQHFILIHRQSKYGIRPENWNLMQYASKTRPHKGQILFCRSTDNLNMKTVMPGLLQQCDKQEFKLLAWTKFCPHLDTDIKWIGQNSQHMVHEPYWNCRMSEFLTPAPMFQHYIFLLKCTICIIYTFIMFRFLCLLLLLWYTLKYHRTVVKTIQVTQYIMQKHIFLHFVHICHSWQSGYNT
jgi:hypothetical protein